MWNDYGFEIIDNRLDHWIPLLEKWCECFERFCKHSGTVPALNKEETHVGVLSGAAWDLGWVGFQEMRRNRYERINYEECCDLYICDSHGVFEDYIECKKERMRNKRNEDDINLIMTMMTKACRQSQSLVLDDTSEKARRVGVVFADFEFPYMPYQNIESSIQDKFDSIKVSIESEKYSAIAWSFPRAIRTCRDEGPKPNSGIVLPGTMLLAKFVGCKTIVKQ
jgi:hypothetical protein